MTDYHSVRFPGEGADYRAARNELLTAERELRRKMEEVAALRRGLPVGGAVQEDYEFAAAADGAAVKLSDLFEDGKSTLILYSFMYPTNGNACPSCTAFVDSLNGSIPHITQRANLAVIAKAAPETLKAWADKRGWNNIRLLSSGGNSYNRDYKGETEDWGQIPMLNVFRQTADGIFHSYASELFFTENELDQHPRHIDNVWPLWHLFDLTPEGRGSDWFPSLDYGG